jgi:hypothetical protein
MIKSVTLQFDKSRNGILSLHNAQHSFLVGCKQLLGQSADKYAECLIGWAETVKTQRGTVAANHKLVPKRESAGNII